MLRISALCKIVTLPFAIDADALMRCTAFVRAAEKPGSTLPIGRISCFWTVFAENKAATVADVNDFWAETVVPMIEVSVRSKVEIDEMVTVDPLEVGIVGTYAEVSEEIIKARAEAMDELSAVI